MIKCEMSEKKSELSMEGNIVDILTEHAVISEKLREMLTKVMGADNAEDMLQANLRLGRMSEEEIIKETKDLKKKVFEKIFGGKK